MTDIRLSPCRLDDGRAHTIIALRAADCEPSAAGAVPRSGASGSVSWHAGIRSTMLLRVSSEEVLRERLRSLAAAAGIPLPAMEVDGNRSPRDPLTAVRIGDGVQRIVVSEELLEAPPAEQHWYLAAALGWWTAPELRRHRRWAWLVVVVLTVPHLGVGLAALFDNVAVPRWTAVVAGVLLPLVIGPAIAALQRRERRALETAGRHILRAARMDPAVVAREVFGGRPVPPWYRRPFAPEPTPGRRVAEASEETGPAPSLF